LDLTLLYITIHRPDHSHGHVGLPSVPRSILIRHHQIDWQPTTWPWLRLCSLCEKTT
jgi:hypothetical protein